MSTLSTWALSDQRAFSVSVDANVERKTCPTKTFDKKTEKNRKKIGVFIIFSSTRPILRANNAKYRWQNHRKNMLNLLKKKQIGQRKE